MLKKKRRVGSEFEEAVFKFAKSLDPNAQVLFNHSVPDRDTGEPRQCDVWINAKFGGHWPLSILVSCKDHKRKLHSGDIGTFRDEVRSTGASTGVIYSRSGFTEPAFRKAKASGFPCCRIYQREPADIPGTFYFEQFACSTQIALDLIEAIPDEPSITWGDIFAIKHKGSTVLDLICEVIANAEQSALDQVKATASFPPDWAMEIQLSAEDSSDSIKIRIFGHWKKYKARMEATLLDGSYCLTNNSFQGTQYGAWIDTQSAHPGEAWTEIEGTDFSLPTNRMLAILYQGNAKEVLQEQLAPKLVHEELRRV
jgi:hypothetical protein